MVVDINQADQVQPLLDQSDLAWLIAPGMDPLSVNVMIGNLGTESLYTGEIDASWRTPDGETHPRPIPRGGHRGDHHRTQYVEDPTMLLLIFSLPLGAENGQLYVTIDGGTWANLTTRPPLSPTPPHRVPRLTVMRALLTAVCLTLLTAGCGLISPSHEIAFHVLCLPRADAAPGACASRSTPTPRRSTT